mgnify:CR=1 FL=1
MNWPCSFGSIRPIVLFGQCRQPWFAPFAVVLTSATFVIRMVLVVIVPHNICEMAEDSRRDNERISGQVISKSADATSPF